MLFLPFQFLNKDIKCASQNKGIFVQNWQCLTLGAGEDLIPQIPRSGIGVA